MSKNNSSQTSKFELLRDKSILAILDGDAEFGPLVINGKASDINISMPYLSGRTLCEISNKFGLPATYGWSGGAQSRWTYLDDLLDYCIQNKRESDLLSFLFSKSQFVNKLKGQTPEVIDYAYSVIIETAIKQINGALYFGGNELIRTGNTFDIRRIGTMVKVAAPAIKTIDRTYIRDISDRAMKDILDGNYDSAITKSRTLLEEVFCYVSKDIDKRINGLLSGLEKILAAISEMRNKGSDSHGVGSKRINISDHHTRLFVNAAMTMADFILAVNEKATTP